jgi:predicted ATPase/class 3 adenylate cyclase/DNA-binding SARP family transcriptional activator
MEIRILGSFDLVGSAGVVDLRGVKRRGLLACLVVHAGQPMSTDRLVTELWGDRGSEGATRTVQTYVSQLRKLLRGEPASLDTRPGGYVLAVDPAVVDAYRFERGVTAAVTEPDSARRLAILDGSLGLWQGPPLGEFAGAGWADREATRLDGLHLQALRRRYDTLLDLDRAVEVAAELEALVRAHPLDEGLWAQYMLALYRSGRQADALGAYQQARRHLVDELGIDPGPELAELEHRILDHDPALATSAGSATGVDSHRMSARGEVIAHSVSAYGGELVKTKGEENARLSAADRLPWGTVTLWFSDIEGSTRAWEATPEEMSRLLGDHDVLLRAGVEAAGGWVFKTVGDAFHAAFSDPLAAVEAAVNVQRALAENDSRATAPVKVRIAVHTGVCEERDGDYFGRPVNRVARLRAIAHGGQTILSGVTAQLIQDRLPGDVGLLDLGEHRLKGLDRPERVCQLAIEGLEERFPPLRSLSRPRQLTNLGIQPTSFIGREQELGELGKLLATARMVTIVGTGGAGKTRLAQQAAVELLDGSDDGIWLVELAGFSEPSRVAGSVLRALGIREDKTRETLEHLFTVSEDREMLIVLDNCEHVIDGVAALCDQMLRRCPHVRMLATSREPLNIDGEHIFRLDSLALPDELARRPDDIARAESVQLFVERAREHEQHFELNAGNAKSVAAICRRLDGIPLALELAAGRTHTMSADQLLTALDQRFRVLTTGPRTAAPRQQTLQALIDWSWQLLSEPEQALLARSAIFPASFDLDAAHNVTGAEGADVWDTWENVNALVAKSLVQTTESGRYKLLETVRDYAANKLAEHGADEAARLRTAHRDYFLELVRGAEPHLLGRERPRWYERLSQEYENLETAIHRSVVDSDPRAGLEMVVRLREFWEARGLVLHAAEMLITLLQQPGSTPDLPLRCRALADCSSHLFNSDDQALCSRCSAEALALAEQLGDPWLTAYALCVGQHSTSEAAQDLAEANRALAMARELDDPYLLSLALTRRSWRLHEAGAPEEMRADLEENLVIVRAAGYQVRVAHALGNLADLDVRTGYVSRARVRLEEASTILETSLDPPADAMVHHNLGLVELVEGNPTAARQNFTTGYAMARRVGLHDHLAFAILGVALASVEQPTQGAVLHGACDAVGAATRDWALAPTEASLRDADRTRLRAALGDNAFDAAYERGRAMGLADAIALAFHTSHHADEHV